MRLPVPESPSQSRRQQRRPRRAALSLQPAVRERVIDNSGHRVGGHSVHHKRTSATVCTVSSTPSLLFVHSAPRPKSKQQGRDLGARAALALAVGPPRLPAGRVLVVAKTARTLVSQRQGKYRRTRQSWQQVRAVMLLTLALVWPGLGVCCVNSEQSGKRES